MHAGEDHRVVERGQATVEFALVLPVVVLFVLAVLQAGLIAKDFLLVHHAAREGARAGAVAPHLAEVRGAATAGGGLDPKRMIVGWSGGSEPGTRATATIRYEAPTTVPLVGRLVGDIGLSAEVTIRIE